MFYNFHEHGQMLFASSFFFCIILSRWMKYSALDEQIHHHGLLDNNKLHKLYISTVLESRRVI